MKKEIDYCAGGIYLSVQGTNLCEYYDNSYWTAVEAVIHFEQYVKFYTL